MRRFSLAAGSLTVALILLAGASLARADQQAPVTAKPAPAPPRSPALVVARVLLVVGGVAMFATGFGAPCGVLGGVTCVPVLGPPLYVPHTLEHSGTPALALTMLAGMEIMQVGGIGMVLGGLLMSDRPTPALVAGPLLLRGGGGLSVTTRF